MKKSIVYIITSIALALSIGFSFLMKVWSGFSYFILFLLGAVGMLWGVYFTIDYVKVFKKELESDYQFYKTEVMNEENLTETDYERSVDYYKKQYKKKTFFTRFSKVGEILLGYGIGLLFLTAMFM